MNLRELMRQEKQRRTGEVSKSATVSSESLSAASKVQPQTAGGYESDDEHSETPGLSPNRTGSPRGRPDGFNAGNEPPRQRRRYSGPAWEAGDEVREDQKVAAPTFFAEKQQQEEVTDKKQEGYDADSSLSGSGKEGTTTGNSFDGSVPLPGNFYDDPTAEQAFFDEKESLPRKDIPRREPLTEDVNAFADTCESRPQWMQHLIQNGELHIDEEVEEISSDSDSEMRGAVDTNKPPLSNFPDYDTQQKGRKRSLPSTVMVDIEFQVHEGERAPAIGADNDEMSSDDDPDEVTLDEDVPAIEIATATTISALYNDDVGKPGSVPKESLGKSNVDLPEGFFDNAEAEAAALGRENPTEVAERALEASFAKFKEEMDALELRQEGVEHRERLKRRLAEEDELQEKQRLEFEEALQKFKAARARLEEKKAAYQNSIVLKSETKIDQDVLEDSESDDDDVLENALCSEAAWRGTARMVPSRSLIRAAPQPD